MNGYDSWKTTEPEDLYEERPLDEDAFGDWQEMTDEEAEARANAAMMDLQWRA